LFVTEDYPMHRLAYFVAILSISLYSVVAHPLSTSAQIQSSNTVFYMGLVQQGNQSKHSLYMAEGTAQPIKLNGEDEDVLTYDVSPDGMRIAFAYTRNVQVGLEIVERSVLNLRPIDLSQLFKNVTSVKYLQQAIWIVGQNNGGKPTIIGLDPATRKIVSQYSMRLNDSEITIHPSGHWAMAYSPTGALGVFNLPQLTQLKLDLSGYAGSRPVWSPISEQFAILLAPAEHQYNFSLVLVDVTKPDIKRITIPRYPQNMALSLTWSKYGHFVVYAAVQMEQGKILKTELNLVDGNTGQITTLDYDRPLRLLDWSPQDAVALVLIQPEDPAASHVPMIYDVASKQFKAITPPSTVELSAGRWSPVTQTLALIGGSPLVETYGVFLANSPDYNANKSVLDTVDGILGQSELYWSPDGKQLVLVNDIAKLEGESLTTYGAIYSLEPETGILSRLSPSGIAVEAESVQIH
jgi:dipeptidyl aminopeptidase/acylaminoacyl peptidase